MRTSLPTLALLFCLYSLHGEDLPKTISTNDLVGSAPKIKIIGPLGYPLGEYVTVEGVPCVIGMIDKKYSTLEEIAKFGVHSLEIHKVNGTPIDPPVTLSFPQNPKYAPADHYTIRGYQTGVFGPGQGDPQDPTASQPQTDFQLTIYFEPTKSLSDKTK